MTLSDLSHREYQVAVWIPLGGDDATIGRILGIGGRTVQNHLHHIYFKLGIEGQAHIKRVKLACMVIEAQRRERFEI
jgi:DNA-binding CsgD family transcriptional regulator